jgi:ribosomal protein L11 methyltransferase
MTQNWIEVRIESSVDSGELLDQLDDPAVTGARQENGVIRLVWPADRWNPDVLQDIRQVLREIGKEMEQPAITVDSLPDQDWNAVWARSVRPIRIGRRVVIRPSRDRTELAPGEIELIIDPKQAFGTGHHATTRLLIEWLEEVIHAGQRVLDVGTGSGILAMVALRLGAASALGIDSNPVAIQCARECAVANRFGPELELRTAALEELRGLGTARFDVVVANLDRRTLQESAAMFQHHLDRGGRLLLSGVLREHQAVISDAFAAAGGVVQRARQCDEWLALEVTFPAV